ncbi:hypothetical protein K438DRAFT_1758055 [Mycena galopus ATCC 62051]|nr:hypothetical protein K438DRAFT_1758055 [Mycena galopus ATCC 62051]
MSVFNSNCPECVAERIDPTIKGDAPPAPCHRHAMSDPKETLRKELTQCQYCLKSKGSGATLQKCGACLIDIYCSKVCQRAAWKTHKVKCAVNRANSHQIPATTAATLKALRAFTSKHRPTVAEAGVRALGVFADPSRAERDVLLILLRPRLDSPRIETSFWVTSASVVPLATFTKAEEMRGQLQMANAALRRVGNAGALLVLLMETDTGTTNVAPVGFPASPDNLEPLSTTWEAWLTRRLNEGVVV